MKRCQAGDYATFERILGEALDHAPGMRLLSYCLMPNHWHMVVWPRGDGERSDFGHYLTLTHTQRWHAHYHLVGTGHLYQGRFKSFPVQSDDHLYAVLRYVGARVPSVGLRPFGTNDWTAKIASKLGLESTLRSRGRPPMARKNGS